MAGLHLQLFPFRPPGVRPARRWGFAAAALATLPLLAAASGSGAPAETVVRPVPAPGSLDNPLKGWCPYTTAGPIRQPYSMVFRYLPWRELEPKPGKFDFSGWERATAADPLARGKHLVLRVYADYPGRPSGMPAWLLEQGVKATPYTDHGGGSSPDYDDPRVVSAMERLIAALGKRYGRNPRVAFIQLGLLGFWGEWHTFPRRELFASEATQRRIVDAYHRAFPRTRLLARYPQGITGEPDWLGYHDDLFPLDTDGPEGWQFLPEMRRSGRTESWRHAVVAGEMVPGGAPQWLGQEFSRTLEAATQGHFSWIGPYGPALEPDQTPDLVARSEELVRKLGYEFSLQEVRHPRSVRNGARFPITLAGANQGIAPFYYSWPVRLALLDHTGRTALQVPLPADIRTWQPGPFNVRGAPVLHVHAGTYRLALGIIDPWTHRPAIGFANNLPRHEGWTYLSSVQVLP